MQEHANQPVIDGAIGLVAHGQVNPGLFVHDALVVGEGIEARLAVVGTHAALPYAAEAHAGVARWMMVSLTQPPPKEQAEVRYFTSGRSEVNRYSARGLG